MSHSQDKSSALGQGVVIFVYLTVLTLLEFFVAVAFEAVPLLILVAIIKAGLVMYYYMHVYKLNQNEGSEDEHSYAYKTGSNRLGLWFFLLSDAFVFGGLLVMRVNLLGYTRPEALNQTLGLLVTSVLLVSSFFMNRGETAMAHGDVKAFMNNTLVTFVLGFGFFLGVVFVEWPEAALHGLTVGSGTPATGPMGGVFYFIVVIGTWLRKKKAEVEIEIPVAESEIPPSKTPAWLDNWKLWIILSLVLVIIGYGPILIQLISNFAPNAVGGRFW